MVSSKYRWIYLLLLSQAVEAFGKDGIIILGVFIPLIIIVIGLMFLERLWHRCKEQRMKVVVYDSIYAQILDSYQPPEKTKLPRIKGRRGRKEPGSFEIRSMPFLTSQSGVVFDESALSRLVASSARLAATVEYPTAQALYQEWRAAIDSDPLRAELNPSLSGQRSSSSMSGRQCLIPNSKPKTYISGKFPVANCMPLEIPFEYDQFGKEHEISSTCLERDEYLSAISEAEEDFEVHFESARRASMVPSLTSRFHGQNNRGDCSTRQNYITPKHRKPRKKPPKTRRAAKMRRRPTSREHRNRPKSRKGNTLQNIYHKHYKADRPRNVDSSSIPRGEHKNRSGKAFARFPQDIDRVRGQKSCLKSSSYQPRVGAGKAVTFDKKCLKQMRLERKRSSQLSLDHASDFSIIRSRANSGLKSSFVAGRCIPTLSRHSVGTQQVPLAARKKRNPRQAHPLVRPRHYSSVTTQRVYPLTQPVETNVRNSLTIPFSHPDSTVVIQADVHHSSF